MELNKKLNVKKVKNKVLMRSTFLVIISFLSASLIQALKIMENIMPLVSTILQITIGILTIIYLILNVRKLHIQIKNIKRNGNNKKDF